MAPSLPVVVIMPVKPPDQGKTRLAGLPEGVRRELAAAFALDTVDAVRRTPGVGAVLAVTDDFRFAARLREHGCEVIPDGAAGDLNASLVQAAAEASRRWGVVRPVVVLADLPALRPAELAAVLEELPSDRAAFLRDARGDGTTVYTAPAAAFEPRFGPGSATAHATAALEIRAEAPSVRLDVDDLADLSAALVMGVGPRTAAVMGRRSDEARGETAGTARRATPGDHPPEWPVRADVR